MRRKQRRRVLQKTEGKWGAERTRPTRVEVERHGTRPTRKTLQLRLSEDGECLVLSQSLREGTQNTYGYNSVSQKEGPIEHQERISQAEGGVWGQDKGFPSPGHTKWKRLDTVSTVMIRVSSMSRRWDPGASGVHL